MGTRQKRRREKEERRGMETLMYGSPWRIKMGGVGKICQKLKRG